MNRIFHARIAAAQYFFLLLSTAITIHEMWMKHAIMTLIFMLLIIIAIERLIHTTYTLTTDGRLVLYYGRFTRSKEIRLRDIFAVERGSSMKIGRFAIMHYVMVKYGAQGRIAILLPVKEDEFIRTLERRLSGEEEGEGN